MASSTGRLDSLWQPLAIGPTTVKNRVMANATTLLYGERNILSDRHIAYYRERARGGTALLVSEQHAVHPIGTGAFPTCCAAWDPAAVPQLAKLADAVHEHDCRFFVQLFAPGVNDSGTMMVDRWHPLWGASRLPSFKRNETPLVMGQAEIGEIVRGHARSARNVAEAGLDGVEIHAAHNWLVAQFLSPLWNDRTDAYGGSVENRCRMALDIATAIRDATPHSPLTVGIQLSVDEYLGDIAITPEDTEAQLEVLAASGLFDYFDVSTGAAYSNQWTIPTMEVPDGFLAPFGKRAREIVGGRASIFLVGRIRDLATAARLVDEGCADMVAMTRAHIADPFLVSKALQGREDETIKCVGENECMLRVSLNREVTCFLNPATGREAEWGAGRLTRAGPSETKRVVVVGGGPAGMQAAAAAARRGHEVLLVERENELGGQLTLLKQLPGRADWQDAIDSLATGLRVSGVETRLGVEADGAVLGAERPDTVLCATGATWDRTGFSPQRPHFPLIPGVDQESVLDVAAATRRALRDPDSLGRRVLVVDETGDYLPVGLADLLSAAGVSVEMVTRHPLVGHNLYATLDAPFVFPVCSLPAFGSPRSISSALSRRTSSSSSTSGELRLVGWTTSTASCSRCCGHRTSGSSAKSKGCSPTSDASAMPWPHVGCPKSSTKARRSVASSDEPRGGVSGREVVTEDAEVLANDYRTEWATCPAGKAPVGGGVSTTSTAVGTDGEVTDSYPTADGWYGRVHNPDLLFDLNMTVFAICVDA
jgi:2,4-dienoyl-CoA reductase-like NADH-dependent reductase (Old Yellow Enzyme family)